MNLLYNSLCSRYNVDCAAASGFYGLAEGAFGSAVSLIGLIFSRGRFNCLRLTLILPGGGQSGQSKPDYTIGRQGLHTIFNLESANNKLALAVGLHPFRVYWRIE